MSKINQENSKNDPQSEQNQLEKEARELLQRAREPQPPFLISKNQLVELAGACQERNFSEEVDMIEQQGGNEWFEKGLCTNFKTGISGDPDDIEKRSFAFQSNEKPKVECKGFFELFFDALGDFTLVILSIAAVISIVLSTATAEPKDRSHAWVEGFAIVVAVVVCSSVTAINDYQKERQFQKLNGVADARKIVSILRNGQVVNLHQSKVLVGDIVILLEGMEIPADGYVLEASELTTDESAMTGETDPIKKTILKNCIQKRDELIAEGSKNTAGRHDVPSCVIMSGTKILTGEGKLLITVVGDSSCVGKISALLRQNDPDETPLQIKLTKIAEDIGKFGLIAACSIVGIMLIRFAIERGVEGRWDNSEHLKEILDFFIIGITVVVVAIPEGLPLAVTLSLAFSVKKMLNDQNLVRKLQACETMGGANNICSDKTGTLTQNKMTLTTIWNDKYIEFKYNDKKMNLSDYFPKHFHELYLMACAVNSSAQIRPDEKGSKTEIAILNQLDQMGYPYEQLREKYSDVFQKMPFSSARKRMSIIVVDPTSKKKIMLTKGASEMVMRSCNKYHNMNTNQIVPIDAAVLTQLEDNIKKMADNALRTICLAYREISGSEDLTTKDNLGVFDIETKDLILMGVFGIADVIRPEVPKALQQCKTAGITVRMVTGDNKDTARAIARQCGLIDDSDKDVLIIEGPKFIEMTGGIVCKRCRIFECECPRDKETAKKLGKPVRVDTIKNGEVFDQMVPHLRVMARSRPEDKYALVTGLIERDNVVAVTGDGTNDAPALKKADVGFAMGIAGTEVAREAASIILLDDNFKSIVSAVMWGRNIYDAIKKFLQFQLTVNLVAVILTLVGAVIIKQEVLTPIQMLWVNLIMDTFASLALATEPPSELLLLRKPHNRYEYIASKKMCKHIIGQAIVQLIILLIMVFNGESYLPEYPDLCEGLNARCFNSTNKLVNLDESPDLCEGIYVNCFDDEILLNFYNTNQTSDKKWPDYLQPTVPLQYKSQNGAKIELNYPYKVRYSDKNMNYVTIGRKKGYDGIEQLYYSIEKQFQAAPSRHYTYIFNVFVMLQIFNFLNARKLQDEFNIFEGLERNNLFIMIIFIIIAGQILLISVGNISFNCYRYGGLRIQQWLICIGFGVISNIASIFFKLIAEDQVIWFNLGWGDKAIKPADSDEEEQKIEEERERLKSNEESNKKSSTTVPQSAQKQQNQIVVQKNIVPIVLPGGQIYDQNKQIELERQKQEQKKQQEQQKQIELQKLEAQRIEEQRQIELQKQQQAEKESQILKQKEQERLRQEALKQQQLEQQQAAQRLKEQQEEEKAQQEKSKHQEQQQQQETKHEDHHQNQNQEEQPAFIKKPTHEIGKNQHQQNDPVEIIELHQGDQNQQNNEVENKEVAYNQEFEEVGNDDEENVFNVVKFEQKNEINYNEVPQEEELN